jgi:hypothetical protein
MAADKPKRKGPIKTARRAAAKKRASATKKKSSIKKTVAKKTSIKKSAAKIAAIEKSAAKKISARKSVPIKKARVSKRALLPPLPPPTLPLKAARSGARLPTRAKVLGRANGKPKAICEIPACTEAELRQKLRLAGPYFELWLAQKAGNLENETTPEAAFVRIWQWLMLEAALEGSHVVITPDLVEKLFAEEMGRPPTV